MDPNSAHQLWSEWTFLIFEDGYHVTLKEVRQNAAKWIAKGFGSAGRVRVENLHGRAGYVITAQVEGAPVQDQGYVNSVRVQFQEYFVRRGWGSHATGHVAARILAGDKQDGKPRDQLVVIPTIKVAP